MKAVLKQFEAPRYATLNFKVEVTSQFNVTAFVAIQKVNRFLLSEVGNLLGAGEPELVIAEELLWRVPVLYALPPVAVLGQVGEVFVDVQSRALVMEKSTPKEVMEQNAEDFLNVKHFDHPRRSLSRASLIHGPVMTLC